MFRSVDLINRECSERSKRCVADTERQPLAQQAAHHWDDAALAHGKDETQQATNADREEGVSRDDAGNELLRDQLFQEAGDNRPEHDERQRLVDDAREYQDEVIVTHSGAVSLR